MLELGKNRLWFIREYWHLFVASLALVSGLGYLVHQTVNGVLLAEDEIILTHSERGDFLATLSIPAIDLKASVFEVGVDDDKRIEAPQIRGNIGWFLESEQKGLARFLVGHNPGVFESLSNINLGGTIIFNMKGQVENYEVFATDQRRGQDIDMDTELKKADLVIMTCAGQRIDDDYTERFIVYARKL